MADPDVLTVALIWGRRMYLRGARAGTTTLTIRFDGREVSYPVGVH